MDNTTQDSILNELIRDACSVVPVSKSEYRKRLLAYSKTDRKTTMELLLGKFPKPESITDDIIIDSFEYGRKIGQNTVLSQCAAVIKEQLDGGESESVI